MAELSDVSNEFIREEIEQFIERPDERQRMIDIFAAVRPELQEISAGLIEGDDDVVDEMTRAAARPRRRGHRDHG